MFRLPYMQEVRQMLLALDVDLCTAGDLRDPDTQNHMRKALTIKTSSPSLCQELEGLKCRGSHPHQQIAGSCKVDGQDGAENVIHRKLSKKVWPQASQKVCVAFESPVNCLTCCSKKNVFGHGLSPMNPTMVKEPQSAKEFPARPD